MKQHMQKVIGDGKSTFFWHDRWWDGGIISELVSSEVFENNQLDGNEKVCEMIENGRWKWENEWNSNSFDISNVPILSLNSDDGDRTIWINKDGMKNKFSVNRAWKDWRQSEDQVSWHKVVWFSHCIPKHSFIFWLAILRRLATQDRIAKWYPRRVLQCSLCGSCPDSVDHLFFDCQYTRGIWETMKKMMNLEQMTNNWDEIMDVFMSLPSNRSIMSIVRRVVIAACIYYIWNERNKRLNGDPLVLHFF